MTGSSFRYQGPRFRMPVPVSVTSARIRPVVRQGGPLDAGYSPQCSTRAAMANAARNVTSRKIRARDWRFVMRVTAPALSAAPTSFLDDLRSNIAAEGIQDARGEPAQRPDLRLAAVAHPAA